MYIFNSKASKYIKKIFTKLIGEVDNFTMIIGDVFIY